MNIIILTHVQRTNVKVLRGNSLLFSLNLTAYDYAQTSSVSKTFFFVANRPRSVLFQAENEEDLTEQKHVQSKFYATTEAADNNVAHVGFSNLQVKVHAHLKTWKNFNE